MKKVVLIAIACACAATPAWTESSRRLSSEYLTAQLTVSEGYWLSSSVAIAGDLVVVGAVSDAFSGVAYVFQSLDGGENWTQVQNLTARDAAAGDWFGTSVAIAGKFIVVGASGIQFVYVPGSAYVFRTLDDGTTWAQVQKLRASDADESIASRGDRFGTSVAIAGNLIVVGALWDDESAWA